MIAIVPRDGCPYSYARTGYANPHAATSVGGATYTYDNNGNVTAIGSLDYTWDWRNRLSSAERSGGGNTTYGYDHTGLRVFQATGSATTSYPSRYYNVASSSLTATTTKHIFSPDGTPLATVVGASTTATTTYLHPDHLGGTNVTTDEDAEVTQTLDYYPYGSQRIAPGSFSEQRRFIGEEYDPDTAFSYLNARYYEGGRGQFLSQDPVFWEIGQTQDGRLVLQNPQLQNSYSYAGNNPIVQKDPTGRLIPQAVALGFLYGGITGAAFQGYSDYQSGSFTGLGAYATAFGRGGITGAATVVSPFLGAGAAGGTSLLGAYLKNGTVTYNDAVNATAEGLVTGVTGGFLKGLHGVRGPQATKVLGGNYFSGAHGVRYAQEAGFGLGTNVFFHNVQQGTNIQISSSNGSVSGNVGSINQLSQAVIGYAGSSGSNLSDPEFIAAIRAINEYNNSLVTSKK